MKTIPVASLSALFMIGLAGYFVSTRDLAHAATQAGDQTKAIAVATTSFLNSLTEDQRARVLFPFVPQKTATMATFTRPGRGTGPGGPGMPPGSRDRDFGARPPSPGPAGPGPAGPGPGRGMGGPGGFVG